MPTDAEGMEIVSRGRDAGSSEDEILEMLVAAGFTTEDAKRQIETIYRIPEDPEEFRARLESAGFPPDVAAWEVDRHALGRKLVAMLTDAGFDDEAARDAMAGLLVEHSERGVEGVLAAPNLDEHAQRLVDLGASPEVAHAVCARFLDDTTAWVDALVQRRLQSRGRSDGPSIADLRAAGPPEQAVRRLKDAGLVDISPFTFDFVVWAVSLRLSSLPDILDGIRAREAQARTHSKACEILVGSGFDESGAPSAVDAACDAPGGPDHGFWILVDRGAAPEVAHAAMSVWDGAFDDVAEGRIRRLLAEAEYDDADQVMELLRAATSPADASERLAGAAVPTSVREEVVSASFILHHTVSPLPVLLEAGAPRSRVGRLFLRRR